MPLKQFSIRDLLLVVALIAVLLGWWIDRHNRAAFPGRFQLESVSGSAVILDTATGQLWFQPDAAFSQPKTSK